MELISAENISIQHNITTQLVKKLIRNGKIKGEKIGSQWMIQKLVISDPLFLYHIKNDVPDKICELPPTKNLVALSFFSGAMGLDSGIIKAGFDVRLCSEIDPNARKTISINEPGIGLIGNIEDYPSNKIRKFAGLSENDEIDLIVGGPPCQAFSTAGKREGFNDSRGNVFLTFIDRILDLRPKYAVIENVRGLLSAPLQHRPHNRRGFGYPPLTLEEDKGGALQYIIEKLKHAGYGVSFNLYNSANFGAPQKRERVVIVCSRDGSSAPFLEPTHSVDGAFDLPPWRTFQDVCSDLTEEKLEYIVFPQKRIKFYELLGPGQYWKHLPVELQKEALGASYFAGGGKTGFLRRLAWNEPSPTLVTNPAMPATDLAHPVKNRPLSVQEYMRLQEFPDNWIVYGNLLDRYKQIGNAVPISLGFAIGKHITKLLRGAKIRIFEGFNYSRYKNTTHVVFEKKKHSEKSKSK